MSKTKIPHELPVFSLKLLDTFIYCKIKTYNSRFITTQHKFIVSKSFVESLCVMEHSIQCFTYDIIFYVGVKVY